MVPDTTAVGTWYVVFSRCWRICCTCPPWGAFGVLRRPLCGRSSACPSLAAVVRCIYVLDCAKYKILNTFFSFGLVAPHCTDVFGVLLGCLESPPRGATKLLESHAPALTAPYRYDVAMPTCAVCAQCFPSPGTIFVRAGIEVAAFLAGTACGCRCHTLWCTVYREAEADPKAHYYRYNSHIMNGSTTTTTAVVSRAPTPRRRPPSCTSRAD